MGDGALVEFPSVVEAVECAVAIQRGMAEREAARPEPERIRFRIGINLGDVLIEGEDLYGDGVNIAARLEALGRARAASCCPPPPSTKWPASCRWRSATSASGSSRTSPGRYASTPSATQPSRRRARPDAPRACGGSAAALLIVAGGAAWLVLGLAGSPPRPGRAAASLPVRARRPSPCCRSPISPIRPTAYFSDGLTEDIAGALARFGELAVIDPAASRRRARPTRRASPRSARELGARYLVRGTVRRDGSAGARHGAAASRRRERGHALVAALRRAARRDLRVQDDITRALAGAMAVRLDQLEQRGSRRARPTASRSTSWCSAAASCWAKAPGPSNREARRILAEAVAKDPGYAPAHGRSVRPCSTMPSTAGPSSRTMPWPRPSAPRTRRWRSTPDLASANRLLGQIFITRRQFDLALAEVDRALAANPSDARSYRVSRRRADVVRRPAGRRQPRWRRRRGSIPASATATSASSTTCSAATAMPSAMLTRGLPRARLPVGPHGDARRPGRRLRPAGRRRRQRRVRGPSWRRSTRSSTAIFFISLFLSEADRAHLRDGLAKAGIGG